ncbi:hypothetical protein [Mycobacterium montefiorense]|uniref:Anti-sigma-M factor RsmA n=1 Tax=Mycobacterium montefiorense TaxID=154654 RepID=A0AA37UWA4_9MYCO|nr:hypothetical protein [Mycobacterium montefiorense]GBG40992.1 anti-sigma-M factor RsmA [Mycobacterium montefiorense]GKU35096.1 anti-sigma-M factor RsmA [Mycobacterium montefiorense]GKU41219.1 anti-sigma-M factor RsmA [Mycobacterium montefiorense]GKU47839.1 anti-sigma-M factor RsmA [Mycobacterium montefiorense]GKU49496.1 anti-sigma-M factor RsmA [Mycobacterium montefiorense]
MGEAENQPSDHDPDDRNAGADAAPTVEALADLQAGLLDDDAAARLRRQVREDPDAAGALHALNQVRRDVAAAGADPESAPEPPAEVTARIAAALRSAGPAGSPSVPAHSARPRIRPARVAAGAAGVLAAIGFGTAALLNAPTPTPSTPTTAEHITVSTPPMAIPLSAAEIVGLLHRAPDYGPLSEPARRASCLGGLGYPASTQVLGARPIEINARPGVLLVLPADTAADLAVFAVALNCSAADTGLLASTQVPRP